MSKTIRRDSLKKIRSFLEQCALITCYRYDDQDRLADDESISVDAVMALGAERGFDRVYGDFTDDGKVLHIVVGIHQNHFYTGYLNIEEARSRMTDHAFAKHFPEVVAQERAVEAAQVRAAAEVEHEANELRIATLTATEPQPMFIGVKN